MESTSEFCMDSVDRPLDILFKSGTGSENVGYANDNGDNARLEKVKYRQLWYRSISLLLLTMNTK